MAKARPPLFAPKHRGKENLALTESIKEVMSASNKFQHEQNSDQQLHTLKEEHSSQAAIHKLQMKIEEVQSWEDKIDGDWKMESEQMEQDLKHAVAEVHAKQLRADIHEQKVLSIRQAHNEKKGLHFMQVTGGLIQFHGELHEHIREVRGLPELLAAELIELNDALAVERFRAQKTFTGHIRAALDQLAGATLVDLKNNQADFPGDSQATLIGDEPLAPTKPSRRIVAKPIPDKSKLQTHQEASKDVNSLKVTDSNTKATDKSVKIISRKPSHSSATAKKRMADQVESEDGPAEIPAIDKHKNKKTRLPSTPLRSSTRGTAARERVEIKKTGTAKKSGSQSDFVTKRARLFGDFAEEE